VPGKIGSKGLHETPIVLGSVKPLCPKDFLAFVVPAIGKKIYVEQFPVRGWNVLQEGKNTSSWMLVPENIEYESCFGCESVSVFRNPADNPRADAPR
jgi:hypothetical protein